MNRIRASMVLVGLVVVLGAPAAKADPLPEIYQTKTVTKSFAGPVEGIEVSSPAGAITIRPGTRTVVVAKERWLIQEPNVSMTVANKVLKIVVTCPPFDGQVNISTCSADLGLTVPQEVSVRAGLNAGSIDIASLTGDEDLTANSGSITISRVIANSLAAGTNSGSVELVKVQAAHITAGTNSGSVDIDDAIAPQDIVAEANSGSVDVGVPAGVYDITADTNTGDVAVSGLTNSSSATRTIVATTNSGSVSVHAR